jgi:hypothetical protein
MKFLGYERQNKNEAPVATLLSSTSNLLSK